MAENGVTIAVATLAETAARHQSEHFDADGDCRCFCELCAATISEVPGLLIESSCICPDCPCNERA